MKQVSNGLCAHCCVLEIIIKQYKRAFKEIPSNWRKRFVNDHWMIVLDKGASDVSKEKLVTYPEKRIITINVFNPDLQGKAVQMICQAFAMYISEQYEQYEDTQEYKFLAANYRVEVLVIKSVYDYEECFFAQMINFYIDCQNEKINSSSYENVYSYISQWMNEEVFDTSKVKTYGIPNVKIGKDVTKGAANMFYEAIKHIPDEIRGLLIYVYGCYFSLENDSDKEKNKNERNLNVDLLHLKDISVKSYQKIAQTLYLKIGPAVNTHLLVNYPREEVAAYIAEIDELLKKYPTNTQNLGIVTFYNIAIQQMILNPQLLKKNLPKTYEYLQLFEVWE